jgi:hypothetical protein
MKKYTTQEQVEILLNTNTATELLEVKTALIEIYSFGLQAEKVFEKLMSTFLELNLIQ